MTKRKQVAETKEVNAVEAIRQGWLAYLGAYGLAFDRAKPALKTLTEKYTELFGELVEKGEEIEETAKEQIVDVRDRAKGVYGAGFEKFRSILPVRTAANDRVEELEAEVAALKKKVAAKTKRATTKTAKAA
jgi:polyhydroxyalkanoate synthesis regulator phasin